ncbi:MAG: substrate-binding domain-containing protein, partial [Casimicrobiaceae bacterium]
EALVNSFLSWSPAAIVLTGQVHSRATLQRLLNADMPIVEMWELGDNPLDTLVGFSHRAAGRAAARHLVDTGRKRLAFVGAAPEHDRRATQRGAGFSEAVIEAGLKPPMCLTMAKRASVEGGGRLLGELVSEHPEIDGIFFSNDVLMLGALFECQRRSIRIPQTLGLIGFGDLEFAAWSQPTLSTIRPPRREIGTAVAEHLLQRFHDPARAATRIDLGFDLVVRGST